MSTVPDLTSLLLAAASPSPSPTSGTGASGTGTSFLTTVLSAAVIAAVISALVSTYLARHKSREENAGRVRVRFAQALEVVAAYKEFPYAIRRRQPSDPEAERIRLSDGLREVQARMSFYLAWTKVESSAVGTAYENLVGELRRVAGKACHDAWLAPSASTDAAMNIPTSVIDLSGLKPYEDAYLAVVQTHLKDLLRWYGV